MCKVKFYFNPCTWLVGSGYDDYGDFSFLTIHLLCFAMQFQFGDIV